MSNCQTDVIAESANGITIEATPFGNQNSSVVRMNFVIVRSIKIPVMMVASICIIAIGSISITIVLDYEELKNHLTFC